MVATIAKNFVMSHTVEHINTFSEFLEQSGSQYRIFDMGRKVQKITSDAFSAFENAALPYPYPLQQHAWIAILFWNKNSSAQHYVWFLKLPLDERGLLEQASRSQFLELVVAALGKSMEKTPDKEKQSALDHNPLIFKPSEQKLAAFNSLVKQVMHLPASEHMTPALTYLQNKAQHAQWQEVAYQGLSDIASRCDDPLFSQAIVKALPELPIESFCALCCSLENNTVNTDIATTLLTLLSDALANNDLVRSIHCARALSHAKGSGFQRQALSKLLASELIAQELDVIVIIAARYWQLIDDIDCAVAILEAVATLKLEQDVFNQIFSDLVAIPSARVHILAALRYPQRSELLAGHIANLIAGQ